MKRHANTDGFSLIEILVAIFILVLGLLGFAALQARATTAELESYQRVQALILAQDIVDRINANRKVASCYVTGSTLGTGYSGTPSCSAGSAAQQTQAINDLNEWDALLKGAAETKGTANVGAMVGARGCISYDTSSKIYTVEVAWQGKSSTTSPSSGLTCGSGSYGSETLRRVVSLVFSIADLTA